MNELGTLNCLDFIDHDSSQIWANKPFSNNIKRCDQLLERCNKIIDIAENNGWDITSTNDNSSIFTNLKSELKRSDIEERNFLEIAEAEIEEKEKKLEVYLQSRRMILESICYNKEYTEVLLAIQKVVPQNFL